MLSPSRRPFRTVSPRPTFRPRLETLEDRTVPAMLQVTSLADDGGAGTLRSLIAVAQTNGDASNTIDFDPSLAGGVITLTAAPLNPATGTFPGPTAFDVNKTLTILGSGQTITRAATAADFRFFFVEAAGSLTLSNLTLSGGLAKGFDSGGTGGGAAGLGGAIFNMGTLTRARRDLHRRTRPSAATAAAPPAMAVQASGAARRSDSAATRTAAPAASTSSTGPASPAAAGATAGAGAAAARASIARRLPPLLRRTRRPWRISAAAEEEEEQAPAASAAAAPAASAAAAAAAAATSGTRRPGSAAAASAAAPAPAAAPGWEAPFSASRVR